MNEKNSDNHLSINQFKNKETGEFVDIETLNDEKKINFILSKLMNNVIENLEMSIHNDRIFSRSRYQVMKDFHAAREELQKEFK